MAISSSIVFGLGATKSGTSWLYDYLRYHPDCGLSSIKELHFFDALDLDDIYEGHRALMVQNLRDQADALGAKGKAKAALDKSASAQRSELSVMARIIETGDLEAYHTFMARAGAGRKVIGDITPCYSLLSAERYRQMAEMGEGVRFIYLMRDPIDRLWSHVRMTAFRRSPTGKDAPRRAGKILERVFSNVEDHIGDRGDYKGTLARIDAALDPSQVFITTTESLFSQTKLDEICGFLQISPRIGNVGGIINQGQGITPTPEQVRAMADFLSPQYQAVQKRLGAMPAGWDPKGAKILPN